MSGPVIKSVPERDPVIWWVEAAAEAPPVDLEQVSDVAPALPDHIRYISGWRALCGLPQ